MRRHVGLAGGSSRALLRLGDGPPPRGDDFGALGLLEVLLGMQLPPVRSSGRLALIRRGFALFANRVGKLDVVTGRRAVLGDALAEGCNFAIEFADLLILVSGQWPSWFLSGEGVPTSRLTAPKDLSLPISEVKEGSADNDIALSSDEELLSIRSAHDLNGFSSSSFFATNKGLPLALTTKRGVDDL
jgi:hypothetical protein